ncbi:hypothetical protein Pcac1_g20495 [Phytophthora cactorum]|nr:hypothetical protein Pcac1_g20495 [Phytophthora cactorum]
MTSSRRNSRNTKRKPNSSHKSKPVPTVDFSTSISSVSSEPTPILESSLASSYQKHVLRRHHQTRGSRRHGASARGGPRDSPFTPRRPVGAVPELFVTFRHVSLAVDVPVSPAAAAAAAQASSGQLSRESLAAKQLPTITNHVRGIAAALTANKTFARRQILKNAMVEELDHLDNDTEAYSQMHSRTGERGLYFDQEALLRVPAFRQSYLRSTWTVVKRQMRLFARNKVFFVGRLLLDLLVGLMVGSVYYGMDLADAQGVRTNTEEIMVRLTPRWDVPPVTLAFQDLRYSITVPADAVVDPAGQRGVEGAPGRPVAVDSRDNTDLVV